MDLILKDKVIIVSGGASGIGASVAERLAREGAIPCILDLQPGAGFSIQVELTDADACTEAVKAIFMRFGKIDGLVNNAGLNDGIGLEAGTSEHFMRSIRRNAGHYFSLAKAAGPALMHSKGAIVNIISKVAFTGQGGSSGYAAANGVRADLTIAWAHELQAAGVRVNGVVVAECRTPQYDRWIDGQKSGADQLNQIQAMIPLEHRLTRPEEIADTVTFLLSPLSAPQSGSLVYVDGGYVHLDRRVSGAYIL